MSPEGNEYPRCLDRSGCLFGQGVEERVVKLEQQMEQVGRKIDKMTQALIGASLTFATAAVMLGINLAMR